jgi:hypothetical protein
LRRKGRRNVGRNALVWIAEGLENMTGVHSNMYPQEGDEVLQAAAKELRRRQKVLDKGR